MQTPPSSRLESAAPHGEYNRLYLWSACLVAALGGLMFGYDWVVISGADIFYEKYFNLTTAADIGWAKGCALAGCLVGSLVAGALSDRFGRKRLLILAAILFTVSSFGTGLANTFATFVVWRIVGGVAIGLASNLSPMCWVVLAEIFPNRIRGAAMATAVFALWVGNFTLTYFFPAMLQRLGAAGTFWVFAGICAAGFIIMKAKLPETKGKTLEQIERELVD